jgi:N-dimethylarginine dimethylaminohydrolase
LLNSSHASYLAQKFAECKAMPVWMAAIFLRLGNLFYVGRSSRTNDAGIEELRDLLAHLGHELRVIDIPGACFTFDKHQFDTNRLSHFGT